MGFDLVLTLVPRLCFCVETLLRTRHFTAPDSTSMPMDAEVHELLWERCSRVLEMGHLSFAGKQAQLCRLSAIDVEGVNLGQDGTVSTLRSSFSTTGEAVLLCRLPRIGGETEQGGMGTPCPLTLLIASPQSDHAKQTSPNPVSCSSLVTPADCRTLCYSNYNC